MHSAARGQTFRRDYDRTKTNELLDKKLRDQKVNFMPGQRRELFTDI